MAKVTVSKKDTERAMEMTKELLLSRLGEVVASVSNVYADANTDLRDRLRCEINVAVDRAVRRLGLEPLGPWISESDDPYIATTRPRYQSNGIYADESSAYTKNAKTLDTICVAHRSVRKEIEECFGALLRSLLLLGATPALMERFKAYEKWDIGMEFMTQWDAVRAEQNLPPARPFKTKRQASHKIGTKRSLKK